MNGSDAPVEELDPLAGIAAGVLRTIDDAARWRPEEALTVEQALHATCVTPAWLSHDERRRGKLIPGYLADLVVLDRDPFACEPEELREVQVVATMVGGRWVHNPPPWDCAGSGSRGVRVHQSRPHGLRDASRSCRMPLLT